MTAPLPPEHAEGPDQTGQHAALSRLDAILLVALCAVGIWFAADSVVLPPTLKQDNTQYIPMAEDPAAFFWVAGNNAQRILPHLLVWASTKVLGIDVVAGFRLVCAVSYVAFLLLHYVVLRRCRAHEAIAFGTTLFCAISYWPITYSLSNVYQACDAMTYPLGLALIVLATKGSLFTLFLVAVVATGTRQQLFALAVFSLIGRYLRTRNPRALECLLPIVLTFALLVAYAGDSTSGLVLADHTVLRLLDFGQQVRGLIETRFPIVFSPFVLVLLLFLPKTVKQAKTYWWATAFAVMTMAQPIVAYRMHGPQNAMRLAMMGAWVAFPLAGLLLRDVLKSPWARWTFAALPILYGTKHLTHLKHTYPSPLGHRTVVNVVVLMLVLAEMYRQRPAEPAP